MVRWKVIVPVVSRELAKILLDSIARNTTQPEAVIIIDNSLGKKPFTYPGLPIDVISQGMRLGVNASWNMGADRARDCDYLAILNDDVALCDTFFERNTRVFEQIPGCGVVCPDTRHDLSCTIRSPRIVQMKKREGWAFSIRRNIMEDIPRIPKALKTFCGDDWIWLWTHRLGYIWCKDTGNIVTHDVGRAVSALGVRNDLEKEKRLLKDLYR